MHCGSFYLVYASQKGTAESIADQIELQSVGLNLSCNKICISDIQHLEDLATLKCIVFVGSTTGEGDPPDAAQKFMKELKQKVKSQNKITSFKYTVLGLGDTNYTNFCNFGKTLDQYLSQIGGERFYQCGWADDGTGLEEVVEPWIEGILPAIKKYLHSEELTSSLCHDTKVTSPQTNIPLQPTEMEIHNSRESNNYLKKLQDILGSNAVITEKSLEDHGIRKLKFNSEDKLTIPSKLAEFLSVALDESQCSSLPPREFPFAASKVFQCQLYSALTLTATGSLKKTMEVSLKIPDHMHKLEYEPGDSFGILTPNFEEEVKAILTCLNLSEKKNHRCIISIAPGSTKKSSAIPSHLISNISLFELFKNCVDIRVVPKKPFLRALLDYASNPLDKRRLMELVSKEGVTEYSTYIREQKLGILDILILFPSLKPPLSVILQYSTKLLPRFYSISSSPLSQPGILRFAFNTVFISKGTSLAYDRKGLCTGYLENITNAIPTNISLTQMIDNLRINNLNNDPEVSVYLRSNISFRLPKHLEVPIIMVGPGTGVAPFVGFLHHRKMQRELNSDCLLGTSYLFYGCRNKEKDYLYEEELTSFVENGTLSKLITCFSRDEQSAGSPRYVQDNLLLYGEELCSLIIERKAVVYVCGDAKNMSKNVFETFVNILKVNRNLEEQEARKLLAEMQVQCRYLQDVWA